MIVARKSAWFCHWFARDAEKRIRRTFARVHIEGLDALRAALAQGPVLVVSNHTAWWDPLVSLVLCQRVLTADAYAMMDAANLQKLPFFAKVGAFGVSLDEPADGARAVRYAAKRLDRPGRLVWIFAQGREVPITARPLAFRPGAAQIARVARRAVTMPVGLRYEHGASPEPSIWISIGPALSAPSALGRDSAPARGSRERSALECHRGNQETAVTTALDRIDRAIVQDDPSGFEILLEGGRGLGGMFATIAQRLLAWMTRPRALR